MLGAILIAVGIVFFVGQQFQIDWGAEAWPFYVIAPGVILLAFGLTQPHGSGMAVGGSIVTMVGLILLYQNLTDHWESWAYAWALVGPGGSGLGMLLTGTRDGNRKMARDGFWMILTALVIFAIGFTPDPMPTDQVAEHEGLRLFVAPEIAGPLDDAVMDVIAENGESQLIFRPAGAQSGEAPTSDGNAPS